MLDELPFILFLGLLLYVPVLFIYGVVVFIIEHSQKPKELFLHDLCFCGSGKEWADCCGKKEAQESCELEPFEF